MNKLDLFYLWCNCPLKRHLASCLTILGKTDSMYMFKHIGYMSGKRIYNHIHKPDEVVFYNS